MRLLCRLSKESFEESLPETIFSGVPLDHKQLYLRLTATQRQLMHARSTSQKSDKTLLAMKADRSLK